MSEFKCVCGKSCSSQPGLTLHQKSCEDAQKARESGQPTLLNSNNEPVSFHPDVQEIVNLVNEMAIDADRCLKEGNKSAGKRARSSLNTLRKRCPEMRKTILQAMHGES